MPIPHLEATVAYISRFSYCILSIAFTSLNPKTSGYYLVNIGLKGHQYQNTGPFVLLDLCADVILEEDFMKEPQNICRNVGREESPLNMYINPLCYLLLILTLIVVTASD